MLLVIIILSVFALPIKEVLTFNLALNERDARYVDSPVMKNLKESSSSTTNIRSSLFGYDFKLYERDDGSISMTVGSPKMTDPQKPEDQKKDISPQNAKGNIVSFDIKPTFVAGIQPASSPAGPTNSQSGDNFGLFVPSTPDGDALACSPTREQLCGDYKYSPGYCYESNNYGKTWSENKATSSHICPVMDVEVLFVLDGSGSVGEENFKKVKRWVRNITSKLELDKGAVKVGVIQYSSYVKSLGLNQQYIETVVPIGGYKNYQEFKEELNAMKLHGYETFTGKALEKVVDEFTNSPNGGKPTTKQVMVLLTDGKATDKNSVPAKAKLVRDLGVVSYAVGVGSETKLNETELRIIANGDPKDDTRVFRADNFDKLDKIAKELQDQIGGLVLEGSSGNSNTASTKMEFAAIAISGAYSKAKPTIQLIRTKRATDNGVNFMGERVLNT